MKLIQNDIVIILRTLRQAVYFAVMIAFVFLLHWLARTFFSETFVEDGVVESIQLGILFAATLSFLIQACINKDYTYILLLLASASMMACFRECDSFFDHLPYLSWKIGFIFPFTAICFSLKNFKKIKKSLIRFLSSPPFSMMVCAMIIVIPVAQCIGHGPFVRNVLGIQNISQIKELFEEAAEALGYMLIFLSSIECIWSMPKK